MSVAIYHLTQCNISKDFIFQWWNTVFMQRIWLDGVDW